MYRLSITFPLLETADATMGCIPILTETLALAPGGTVLCSTTLVLTQHDVDSGLVSSEVSVRGYSRYSPMVSAEEHVEIILNQATGVSVGEIPIEAIILAYFLLFLRNKDADVHMCTTSSCKKTKQTKYKAYKPLIFLG